MQIPWGDGATRTMCARAVEPTHAQKAAILALKGITAASGLSVPVGAKAGLIALVIETNKCFDDMVGEKFPRKRATVKRPMHVNLGVLQVKGGGVLSITQADIGTGRTFYDITKAEEDGHFGPDPVIWKAQELHVAIELIASALDLEGDA